MDSNTITKWQKVFIKKMFSVILSVIMCIGMLTGCTGSGGNSANNTQTSAGDTIQYLSGKVNIEIQVASYGTIEATLDADAAPITVTNFVNLAKSGFYDGLTFHRIISGFMIQGGDPKHNGTGGADTKIKGEFAKNGVENTISHKRGTISMARSSSYDSASSQFFIMHEDRTNLDGQYAAFGTVTSGMDVVDAICNSVKPLDDNGTVPYEKQPVITTIKVLD